MKIFSGLAALLLATTCLTGCMALVLAPVANAVLTEKPAQLQYTTTAKPAVVFNAALKAVSTKGTATTIDRETGTIRGDITVSMGQAAYNVVITVAERGGKTVLVVSAKLVGLVKFDLKNATDLANEIVTDIEQQLGTKLERT